MTAYLPLALFFLSTVSLIAAPLMARLVRPVSAAVFAAGSIVFLTLAIQVAE